VGQPDHTSRICKECTMLDHAGVVQHRHRAVAATEDADDVLQLMTAMHGPVVLYLAPDTDGRTPICVRRTDFRPEPGDALAGRTPISVRRTDFRREPCVALAGRTAWHTEFWLADWFREGIDDIDVSIDVRSAREADRPDLLESSCGFRFALRIES